MMLLSGVDLPGLALVLATVAPTLAVVLTWWETRREGIRKDVAAQASRDEARAIANAKLDDIKAHQTVIADKTDQVHDLVNGQRAALIAEVDRLKAEIARLRKGRK